MRQSGFWTGVGTLVGAARLLLSNPNWWRLTITPVLVLLGLSVTGISLVLALGMPAVFHLVAAHEASAWYLTLGGVTLALLTGVAGAFASVILAWVLTPPLCSPLFERLVQHVERALGAPSHPALPFVSSVLCGVRAQLVGVALLAPVWLTSWLVGLVFPFLLPVLVPVRLLALSLSLAWNLLDYPLTLRGVSVRGRLRFLRRHASPVLGFGLAFALLFWIPLAAVALLPLGVVGATQLVWMLAKDDPEAPLEWRAVGDA